MAGHFPFSGNTNRVSVFAFYERYGLNQALQEKYYKWWYEWAKKMVASDPGLQAAKGMEFNHYPYGQHSHVDFHLRQGAWTTALIDLGGFIKGTLLPILNDDQLHHLDEEHHQFLHHLEEEASKSPRQPQPELGWFRHS
ncbi:MAG: hypothetical protein M0T86_08310 [Betaproteobacteria bacterium]|nr:hypothetical protein [Betaproteobacteria bacterium]